MANNRVIITGSDGNQSTLASKDIGSLVQAGTPILMDAGGVNLATIKAASTAPLATDTALVVGLSPNSAMSVFKFRNLAATVTAIKASGGHLWAVEVVNSQAAIAYIQIFNVASGSVTLGTTTPDLEFLLQATSGAVFTFPDGIPFATAISIASTTTEGGAVGSAAGVMVFAQYV